MRSAIIVIALLCAVDAGAATTYNDDSCDIGVTPAATLLLPYFEVEIDKTPLVARTTMFSVVNTSQYPQIARVTLWSDLAFPVMNFNLFLTGYDVQSINLYDVLTTGAAAGMLTAPGDRSLPNDVNPNHASTLCDRFALPAALLADVRSILTTGRGSACPTDPLGTAHAAATGYVTIDVVNSCNVTFPDSAAYYDELLYDNVLIGDYEQINPHPATGNYASGSPLVHIRAVPEGGLARANVATNLPRTFYDRYTPRVSPHIDRRQPLPSAFTARFIQGGTGAFNTNLQIWREGFAAATTCADYKKNYYGTNMDVRDIVRFDEHENSTSNYSSIRLAELQRTYRLLPAASSTPTSSAMFPPLSSSGDAGGWIYLSLTYPAWVTTVMSAEGRFSVAYDAQMLGNGCSPAPKTLSPIGPAPNINP